MRYGYRPNSGTKRTLSEATVNDGRVVRVGDCVDFKSDYEQVGKVVEIYRDEYSRVQLVLENESGFGGEYLRYAKRTTERADDCY